jgi:hypothetical protein
VRIDHSNGDRDSEPTFIFDNNVWDEIFVLSSGRRYVYNGYLDEGVWHLGFRIIWGERWQGERSRGNSRNSLAISFIRWLLECALLCSELPMLKK